MRGFPFHGQGKGGLGVLEGDLEGSQAFLWVAKRPKFGIQEGLEPRSVLDHRSPSPPASTATLSSSLGGSGSSDTAGVAAVSDSPAKKSVLSDTAGEVGGGAGWKEEWAAELQPIPAGLDLGFDTGGAKCGLGVDDWETMLSENSAVSPVREQTFLGWIMGDVGDPASARLRQQQILPQSSSDFGGNNGGFGLGILDPSNCRIEDESIAFSKGTSVLHNTVGGGFPFMNSNSCVSLPSAGSGIKGIPMIHQAGSQLISHSLPPPPLDNNFMQSLSLPPGIYLPDTVDEKLQLFGTGLISNQPPANPNPPVFPSVGQAEHPLPHLIPPTQPKRHLPMEDEYITKLPFLESGGSSELFPRHQQHLHNLGFPLPQLQQRLVKPKLLDVGQDAATPVAVQQQQQLQQALVDQLIEAAKMVEAKNFDGAHGILARLNHQLPSPLGKPLIRSTFYFKEALQHILCHGPSPVVSSNSTSHHQPGPLSTPMLTQFDIVHKLGAYKAFSEVSPIIQFSNFTCIQALLEELRSFDRIHIVDFDIGVGGQWSSFMQELAQRRLSSAYPVRMLKISVLVSDYTQNNLELQLVRDSLSLFANDLDIPFEFYFHNLESFDPLESHVIEGEAIAVNLPIVGYEKLSFPSILRLVKQLSPKIVISVDQGCDRSDLPFLQHFLHAFQSSMVLMDSIDASGTNQDMTAKIEKFLLQPRIKSSVLGRYDTNDKILPWRTLFTTSGFIPVQLSNFLEAQADCLLKRVQVRGFHVEKRQSTIYLYWQRKELVSVSAWRC